MENKKGKLTIGKIIFTLIYILIFPALLLFLSGDWLWAEGWIFSVWFTVLCFSTIIYLYINDFVSSLIRIQKERGQQVISTGVYSIVRHPMYLGGTLLFIGTPLFARFFIWYNCRSASHLFAYRQDHW